MKRQFTGVYKKIDKWYVAWVEEVPGANTQGKTLKEVKENLKEALALILEANQFLSKKEKNIVREPLTISV